MFKNFSITATGLWKHTAFKYLWSGQAISTMGSQISYIAIPLIAVVMLNATSFQMGLLTAASTAPFFIVGLFAGVWVDRVRRIPILINSNFLAAVILILIPFLSWLNVLNIWLLYIISFLSASCSMIFQFAYTSILPSIVSKEELTEGNSKLEATRATTQFIGPSIAGVLIHTFTAPFAILIDVISYFLSIFFFRKIKIIEVIPEVSRGNMFFQIKNGFTYIFSNPFLRTISLTTALLNFSRCAFDAVYVLYIVNNLLIDAAQIGLIYGVGSVGSIIGALLASKFARNVGTGYAIITSTTIIGIGFMLVSFASGQLLVILPVLFLSQFCTSLGNTIFFITQVSIRQAVTPNEIMGSVNATQVFISRGAIPLGAVLGGLLGTLFGLRLTIFLAGCLSLSAVFLLLFSPVRSVKKTTDVTAVYK